MATQTKIYIILAAIAVAIILGIAAWSRIETGRLEKKVRHFESLADAAEARADARELEAAEYKQKITYLESQIAEIRDIARNQDEELKTRNSNTSDARRRVTDARNKRPGAVTDAELCRRLAEVGYPCRNAGTPARP